MENLVRPVIVIGGSVLLTLAVGWATDRLLRKADERDHDSPLWSCCAAAASPTSSCCASPCSAAPTTRRRCWSGTRWASAGH